MRTARRRKPPKTTQPVGSFSIRRVKENGKVRRVRYVKVADAGPYHLQWRPYARWWWEQNRGSVPPGKIVLHLDRDSLNDAPDNLALGTVADTYFLWAEDHPEKDDAHRRRLRDLTVKHNRERGRVARATRYLAARWYAVDFSRRVVLNRPCRMRHEALGLPGGQSWRQHAPAALGWPGLRLVEAAVLAALVDDAGEGGMLTTPELLARVREVRRRWYPQSGRAVRPHAVSDALVELRRAGLVLSFGGGVGSGRHAPKRHRATARARAQRGPVGRWTPVRGSELSGPAFVGFTRIEAESQKEISA